MEHNAGDSHRGHIKPCILSKDHGRVEVLAKRGGGRLDGLVLPAQNLMIAGRRGAVYTEISQTSWRREPAWQIAVRVEPLARRLAL